MASPEVQKIHDIAKNAKKITVKGKSYVEAEALEQIILEVINFLKRWNRILDVVETKLSGMMKGA